MKTKRQRKGRVKTPAQVPPLKPGEVADEGIFRSDLRRLEQNNREFFSGGKDDEVSDIEIKKKEN